VDLTGSRALLMVDFGIISVEPLSSATTVLVSKMNFMEIGFEDGRWMELAQDCVKWWALLLVVLNLQVLPHR
jgi:hypothetical protein